MATVLANAVLELHYANGAPVPLKTIGPPQPASAIARQDRVPQLAAGGKYVAIVAGKNDTRDSALVEVLIPALGAQWPAAENSYRYNLGRNRAAACTFPDRS